MQPFRALRPTWGQPLVLIKTRPPPNLPVCLQRMKCSFLAQTSPLVFMVKLAERGGDAAPFTSYKYTGDIFTTSVVFFFFFKLIKKDCIWKVPPYWAYKLLPELTQLFYWVQLVLLFMDLVGPARLVINHCKWPLVKFLFDWDTPQFKLVPTDGCNIPFKWCLFDLS